MGYAVVGNGTAVVIVNETNGVITAKLQPLSSDMVVVGRPQQ